jgi:hypothetical protein
MCCYACAALQCSTVQYRVQQGRRGCGTRCTAQKVITFSMCYRAAFIACLCFLFVICIHALVGKTKSAAKSTDDAGCLQRGTEAICAVSCTGCTYTYSCTSSVCMHGLRSPSPLFVDKSTALAILRVVSRSARFHLATCTRQKSFGNAAGAQDDYEPF